MTEKLCSSSLCLLGWLQSVNLCSSSGFLLKSGFLENICVVLGNRSTLTRACWCLFTVCSVGKLWKCFGL